MRKCDNIPVVEVSVLMFEGSWQKDCASGSNRDCAQGGREVGPRTSTMRGEGRGSRASAGSAEVRRDRACSVVVLMYAVSRHLVAHRSAAVKFAKAIHAAIDPLMSDVVKWGSCAAGQSSMRPHTDASFAREHEGHGGITPGLSHAEVDERRRAKENKRHNLRRWPHAFVCLCVYA